MRCPYCDYVDGWDAKTLTDQEGKFGKFYEGNKMERYQYNELKFIYTYGCPKCKKVFIS